MNMFKYKMLTCIKNGVIRQKTKTSQKWDVFVFWWNSEGSRTSGKANMPVACLPAPALRMCAAAEGSARAERLPSPYREGVHARGVEGASLAYWHGLQVGTRFRL